MSFRDAFLFLRVRPVEPRRQRQDVLHVDHVSVDQLQHEIYILQDGCPLHLVLQLHLVVQVEVRATCTVTGEMLGPQC